MITKSELERSKLKMIAKGQLKQKKEKLQLLYYTYQYSLRFLLAFGKQDLRPFQLHSRRIHETRRVRSFQGLEQ